MTPSLDLFIFSDALGWKLAEERQFLSDLLPHRSPCETLLGYSCTCDPAILTGTLPPQNGHFSSFIYSPSTSPFQWARYLAWIPERLIGHHRIRSFISRKCASFMGITGYFQLYAVPFSKLHFFDYTEKKDIYLPGGINGGQEVIFTLWDRLGIPWYRSDWRAGDARNVVAMKNVLTEGKVRCAYLFTGGLDAAMHAHTTHGPEVDKAFSQLEQWIRELHQIAAKNYHEVRIHLFSDHGMTDTAAGSDMLKRFESLNLKFGEDYAAVWDSTMARFWCLKPGVQEKISLWLAQQKEGSILSKAQLEKWSCYFPDGRYGDLIFLLKPGTIFVPSHMSRHKVPAMHGFAPEDPTSTACWLSSHPTEAPRRIEQIYHVMRAAAEKVAQHTS